MKFSKIWKKLLVVWITVGIVISGIIFIFQHRINNKQKVISYSDNNEINELLEESKAERNKLLEETKAERNEIIKEAEKLRNEMREETEKLREEIAKETIDERNEILNEVKKERKQFLDEELGVQNKYSYDSLFLVKTILIITGIGAVLIVLFGKLTINKKKVMNIF